MARTILVLKGHPAQSSFCDALADRYIAGAEAAGAQVQVICLRDLAFDPVLYEGYKQRQDWEPDLQTTVDAIQACDHLTLAFPMWWGQMPALLKGFIDRVFLPGVAFKYHDDDPFWDRLYAGRSADAIVTMDTPPWYLRFAYRDPLPNMLKRQVLGFCGFKPARLYAFGPVRSQVKKKGEKWLAKAEKAGREAASLKAR